MPEGVKRIIVDGASFWNAMRILQVQTTDFAGTLHVLRDKIGLCRTVEHAIVTIYPRFCQDHKQPEGLYHDIIKAGWEVRKAQSLRSADDEVVSCAVHDCLAYPSIRELVLATSDGKLIKELMWVADERRKRKGNPLRAFVFATCTHDEDGHCRICNTVLKGMNDHPDITFCEMLPFRHLMMAEPEHYNRRHRS